MANIITPIGSLLCYGNTLFQAKRNKLNPNADPRFEGHLIFDAAAQKTPEFKVLHKSFSDALRAEFGSKMDDASFVKKLKLGLKKEDDGTYHLKAWTYKRPGVVNASLQEITVPDDVWSGQLARFEVNPWTYNRTDSKGGSFGLTNVQITKRDMPRTDGRKAADKVFGQVEDEAGGSNAGDDDMPF